MRPPRRLGTGPGRTPGETRRNHGGRRHRLPRTTSFLITLVVLAGFASASPVSAQENDDGAATYQQFCASCHQPDGTGVEGAFPPLAGNTNVTDPAYVIDVITNGKQGPITVDGVTYDGVMPPVAGLSDAQIDAVAAHVAGLAGTQPQTTAPPATSASGPTGADAARGEDLFAGRIGLSGGGATCSSCHAAGPYGGATLGPDLTDAFSRLGGEAGLSGWLAAPPSATMQPIFGDHPLTEDEISDIVAFLASVDGTQPERGPDLMLAGAGVGVVLLFGVMSVFFRRPRGRYVDRLRSRT